MVQFEEIEPHILETHLKVSKVLDGDSLKVVSMFGKNEKEIRLYGLDAPEIKRCRKLRKQELETQIPAELLLKLGRLSLDFVLSLAPPSTKVTLITEKANYIDFYGRQMGYIILPDGRCLNELLLSEGFAKIETEYRCSQLPKYNQLHFSAKQNKKGLYEFTRKF